MTSCAATIGRAITRARVGRPGGGAETEIARGAVRVPEDHRPLHLHAGGRRVDRRRRLLPDCLHAQARHALRESRGESAQQCLRPHLGVEGGFFCYPERGLLMRPVSVAWIFATLREMEFHFDVTRLAQWRLRAGPAAVSLSGQHSFSQLHERDTRIMSNYRPATADKP